MHIIWTRPVNAQQYFRKSLLKNRKSKNVWCLFGSKNFEMSMQWKAWVIAWYGKEAKVYSQLGTLGCHNGNSKYANFCEYNKHRSWEFANDYHYERLVRQNVCCLHIILVILIVTSNSCHFKNNSMTRYYNQTKGRWMAVTWWKREAKLWQNERQNHLQFNHG
jgi:hypothetical protein